MMIDKRLIGSVLLYQSGSVDFSGVLIPTILDDVSLKVPQGSVIGIAGRSGSGKSTLLKLLMRFWQVQKGSVKISDEEIEEACKKASVHDFIMSLP